MSFRKQAVMITGRLLYFAILWVVVVILTCTIGLIEGVLVLIIGLIRNKGKMIIMPALYNFLEREMDKGFSRWK